MPEIVFHTTFSTSHFPPSRAKNGSESGLWSAVSYRFGFNGQEMDNEISGQTGTHTTAMFWEYDSRLGRRWNLDPKPQISISDYACFANNPVWFSDPLGDKIGYGKTEYRSKAGVFVRVMWNWIIDKNFRRTHNNLRRDPMDTYTYQEVDPNDIQNAAVNPRSIITRANPLNNNNPYISGGRFNSTDNVQDQVFLNYRTRNKERHHWWGAGKGFNGKFKTKKEQHYNSDHTYSAGTITIRGTSNSQAGPRYRDDTGPDNLIIRQNGVIIYNTQMPTNDFRDLRISFRFNSGTAGSISFEISNQNFPNNTPGAFDLHVKIRSL